MAVGVRSIEIGQIRLGSLRFRYVGGPGGNGRFWES
jgi:hypothetical protein